MEWRLAMRMIMMTIGHSMHFNSFHVLFSFDQRQAKWNVAIGVVVGPVISLKSDTWALCEKLKNSKIRFQNCIFSHNTSTTIIINRHRHPYRCTSIIPTHVLFFLKVGNQATATWYLRKIIRNNLTLTHNITSCTKIT